MRHFDFVMSEVHGLRVKELSAGTHQADGQEAWINADCGQEDVGQVQTRVETFIERLRG